MNVNGTIVWYFSICEREAWLMHRKIIPNQHDDNIEIGKYIHENSYKRSKKEIKIGNVIFDLLYEEGNKIIIGETKKSSKFYSASRKQLLYYLWTLKKMDIIAKGILHYPEERKKIEVVLREKEEREIRNLLVEIEKVLQKNSPPRIIKKEICKSCAYQEYCFS